MSREEIQLEALNATKDKKKCSIILGTGVGKTLVGLKHIEKYTTSLMKILVVAPKKSIFQSWKDDAEKFNMTDELSRITFTTYLSLNKQNPNDYDIVYLDEAHSLLDSHREFLENYKGKILGLTGTPPKYKDSEKGMLIQEFCPEVYNFSTDSAVDNNILNDYKIIVHELKLSHDKNLQVNLKDKSFMTSEIQNYDYWCNRIEAGNKNTHIIRIMRMKAMMEYSTKEKYASLLFKEIKNKCILFANTQEQADKMCLHSYHSNNENSEENLKLFKEGTITKLSCVLQLNEGVNIPNLKQGIIMHAYGNERKTAQRIGRLLRLNPDDKAIIHILCYVDTVDEKWVNESLEGFDSSKIIWKNFNISL